MRTLLFLLALLTFTRQTVFSQKIKELDSTLFLPGIYCDNIQYTFKWEFNLTDVMALKLNNFESKKTNNDFLGNISFDSVVILKDILLTHVIIKYVKKKEETNYEMKEFIGFLDPPTLNKLAALFNYQWKGFLILPKNNPFYRIKFAKDENEGYFIISKL